MRMNKEVVLFGGWGLILLLGFIPMKFDFMWVDTLRPWIPWLILTPVGFGLMALTMDLRDRNMQLIIAEWAVLIGVGFVITYQMHTGPLGSWFNIIGAIWLGLMGLGHVLCTLIVGNRTFLWLGAAQLVAAAGMYLLKDTQFILDWQFVITGVVSAAAMFYLIIPRPVLLRARI